MVVLALTYTLLSVVPGTKSEECIATIFAQPGDKHAGGRSPWLRRRVRPTDLGIAHRTRPLGSWVRVTNLRTGKSARVRVIDRGPFGRTDRNGSWYNGASEYRTCRRRGFGLEDPACYRSKSRFVGCADLTPAVARRIGHNGKERVQVDSSYYLRERRVSKRTPIGERIWRRVARGDGCWEWQGYRDRDGYGDTHMYVGGERKTVRVHRAVWEIERGPIPDGLCVLHRCDNPSCVRPDHLFLGTVGDNNRDARDKGRGFLQTDKNPAKLGRFRGSKNGRALLTENQVRRIRTLYENGQGSYRSIGKRFGVGKHVVYAIVRRRAWKNVA